MEKGIIFTTVIVGGYLIMVYPNVDDQSKTYFAKFTTAALLLLLGSIMYKRFIYAFYTSSLVDIPLLKRKRWSECFSLIQAPAYLDGMENVPNNGILRRLDMFNQESIIVTSPQVAAEFFQQKSDDYVKWPAMSRVLKDFLGSGLLTAEQHDHKVQRKAVTPAFTPRTIKSLYPVFWSQANHLTSMMNSSIATSSENPAVLDMADYASRVSLDIISEAGFGSSFQSLDQPQNALNRWYRSAFMVDGSSRLLYVLMLITHPGFVNRFSFLRLVKSKVEGIKGVRKWIQAAIDGRKKEIFANVDNLDWFEKSGHKDIISAMMKSGTLNTDGLTEQSLTFLGAGHETTATSFSWAIHELAQPENQHYQTKLREEICTHLPSPKSNIPLTAEMLDGLPFLDIIVKENLRLHAPAPSTGRVALRDTILAGRLIPKGTPVRISPWAMNRSKKLWGQDAEVFRPERWHEFKSSIKDVDPQVVRDTNLLHNITFGHGPRVCIGKGFAIASLKALLAASIASFEFKQVGNKHVDAETVFTITGKIKELNVETRVVDGW